MRQAYIGLGANQGDLVATLNAAVHSLGSLEQSQFVAASPFYLSAPIEANGPDYLNVLRVLDIPQAAAMASERLQVRLMETDSRAWDYPIAVRQRLAWHQKQFVVEPLPSAESR